MIEKRIKGILLLLAVLLMPLGAVEAQTEEASPEPGTEPVMTEEMKAEMNAWMKLAEPGEFHGHLGRYVGSWEAEIKMWMAPDAEPMVNQAETECRWILGDRYLEWQHRGEFDGSPFEGRAIEGYNNLAKRFESVWTDNFGTLILFYTGQCSEGCVARQMSTEFTNPMTGGMLTNRAVYTWIDDDHFKYESYMSEGGVEHKNMEIVYTRK